MAVEMLTIDNLIVSSDKSTKYLLRLTDGSTIEAVHIPLPDETKVCISCQVGCVNKCRHCATGRLEYIRDMTADEIVGQVKTIFSDKKHTSGKCTVLFMGMGEPLLNYEPVMASLNMFSELFGISSCCVTISTAGVPPAILKVASVINRPKLAVSIHATNDSLRDKIIPLNKVYNLNSVLAATKEYTSLTNDSVIIQYTLMSNINDSLDEALALADMVKDIPCEVQVIPFNPFPGTPFLNPGEAKTLAFVSRLQTAGAHAVVKRSSSIDVYGGCGQLGVPTHGPSPTS